MKFITFLLMYSLQILVPPYIGINLCVEGVPLKNKTGRRSAENNYEVRKTRQKTIGVVLRFTVDLMAYLKKMYNCAGQICISGERKKVLKER